MTPDEVDKELAQGSVRPLYLVVGEERQLVDQVVGAIRKYVSQSGIAGLNDDTFTAPGVDVDEVLATTRTLPMLAPKRFVLVRSADKWESDKPAKAPKGAKAKKSSSPFDQLLSYAEDPAESAVLVLSAEKIDKRKKLYTSGKKLGFLVLCDPPSRGEVPGWIGARIKARGNSISRSHAELISELMGTDLAGLTDAVERLCLYAGDGKPINDEAIAACVTRVPTHTVWELVSAVGSRNAGRALEALGDVYDPHDKFRLLGLLAWAARQLLKFDAAIQAGMSPPEAAKAAGAPPFKAGELASQVRQMPKGALERWLEHLSAADLAMKGGSRRPDRAVVERMLLDLCEGS